MGQLMGQWVMGLGCHGSDGSWVTNGDPWSTLFQIICLVVLTLFLAKIVKKIKILENAMTS